jgi:Tfp pilus assembly protein PilN
MKRFAVLPAMIILFFICVQPVLARSTDEINTLKKEIDILKESQKAMQKDIQEIKNLLQKRQAPPEFKEAIIDLGDNPFKGDKNAKLIIAEFSDYQ